MRWDYIKVTSKKCLQARGGRANYPALENQGRHTELTWQLGGKKESVKRCAEDLKDFLAMQRSQAKAQTEWEVFGKWWEMHCDWISGSETGDYHVDRLDRTTCVTVKKMDFILLTAGDPLSALSTESHCPICYHNENSCRRWCVRENNKLKMILDSCCQKHPPVFCVDKNEDRNVLILLWKIILGQSMLQNISVLKYKYHFIRRLILNFPLMKMIQWYNGWDLPVYFLVKESTQFLSIYVKPWISVTCAWSEMGEFLT